MEKYAMFLINIINIIITIYVPYAVYKNVML